MSHDRTSNVTSWVRKFAPLVQPNATVLDLACGGGRHTEFFLARGHQVIALDKDTSGLAAYADDPACQVTTFDLESSDLAISNQSEVIYSEQLPFFGRNLQCIVVVNYLHRPLMSALIQALSPGGILIYQTFMAGNEQYGRPKNADFLLSPLELANTFNPECDQIDFFEGFVSAPKRAVIQCYCGRKR
ncbi:MAG: SAM-dependent methyltransferase [Candidatus Azotimanducaceae bacterium]|jgi:SAM-dependent methyltransferase